MEQTSGQPSTELLEPVNLRLDIKRNLAASWYKKMVAVEIDGDLKPMKVGGGGGGSLYRLEEPSLWPRLRVRVVTGERLSVGSLSFSLSRFKVMLADFSDYIKLV